MTGIPEIFEAMEELPDDAPIIIEGRGRAYGRYRLVSVHAFGTRTDQPFLRLLIEEDDQRLSRVHTTLHIDSGPHK